MLNLKQFARRLKSTDGAEIAEAAVVLPLAFLFMFGIIWFGRAFNIYSTITQAAQQGAIAAARDTCATCGNALPGTSAAANAISAVMKASSIDVTQMQANNPPNCGAQPCSAHLCPPPAPNPACTKVTGATGNFYVCQNVLLNPTASTPQCGTVVSFQYPFQFNVPYTSLNNVLLTAQAQTRMEN